MLTVTNAAIQLNEVVYKVPIPGRHHDVIREMATIHKLPTPIRGTQGFVLSDGTFASRIKARQVAFEAGQILEGCGKFKELYSEDVWRGKLEY